MTLKKNVKHINAELLFFFKKTNALKACSFS